MQFAPGYQNVDTTQPAPFTHIPLMSIPQSVHKLVNDPTSNWLHVPPTQMPWGIPAANQPSIVRFTAERFEQNPAVLKPTLDMGLYGNVNFSCQPKRKIEPDVELPPSKMLITEEKMAAHMSQLHISNTYVSHQPEPTPCTSADDSQPCRRLIMCDELRQLTAEPILPPSILNKLERPTMALVLWQPPAGQLGEALQASTRVPANRKREEEEKSDSSHQVSPPVFPILENNNSTTIDLNSLPGFIPTSEETLDMDM